MPNLNFDTSPPPSEPYSAPPGDRAAALALVKAPALSLMIVSGVFGGLSILAFLLVIALFVFVGAMEASSDFNKNSGGTSQPSFLASNAPGMGVAFVESMISVAWAVAVFLGAQRMMQLRTYPFAMTASILAMVPLSGCVCGLCTFIPWLVTLGFGIWSLVILCRPEVKSAFQ